MKIYLLSVLGNYLFPRYRNLIIMKLIIVLVIALTFQSHAGSVAQTVSLLKKVMPIREVFREIKRQTGYTIICDTKVLRETGAISVNLKNKPLDQALEAILAPRGLEYVVDRKSIVVRKVEQKPIKVTSGAVVVDTQKRITGKVVNAEGEALPGISIALKGKTTTTATDESGNYSIEGMAGDILVFSSVGYQSRDITIGSGSILNVTLQVQEATLDEVIVVGFGTQKKVNLTGAVGTVSAKELESRPVTSATQALQGLVPGLKITGSTGELNQNMSISVRGTGTIGNSNGSPLILIDGMEADLNTVNPQDIENISILKDAAASSIYGARAPFGVILVTTKSGKQGRSTINYNNSLRNGTPLNLPTSMDSYSFGVMLNQAQINSGASQFFSNATLQKMLDFQAGKLTDGIDVSPTNPNAWSDQWSMGYGNTDVYPALYKSNVFAQEHNLSMSGGSENITYYTSGNFLDQDGLLRIGDDGIRRYNVTGKIEAKLKPWLSFNYSTRWTNNKVWVPTYGMRYNYFGRQNWPNIPLYDPNGNLFQANTREIAEGGRNDVTSNRNYQQAGFTLEPVKGWITKVELNYSGLSEGRKEVSLPVYEYLPNGNRASGLLDSRLLQHERKERYLNTNVFSEYSRSFADSHNVKIMGGFQTEQMRQNFFSAQRVGLYVHDMPEFDLTTGLGGNGIAKETIAEGYSNEWATAGFFGRLNYDFKGKYLFEGNLRYDGSSRFRSNSRWVMSPSFSAGWNVAQEDFWQPLKGIVNTLKPRFSYGQLSNQNTNLWYPTYRVMDLSAKDGDWLTTDGKIPITAAVGPLISTNLTWETVRSWNLGLDYGLFNNKLSGSFDYFTRYTLNMVGPAPELPGTLGIGEPDANNTDLSTKGWELSLAWRDQTKFGMNYGANLTLSDQNTYIDRYPGNPTNSIGPNGGTAFIAGQRDGLIWGYETIGIAKSQAEMDAHLASLTNGGQNALGTQWAAGDIMYRDLDGDGRISQGSRTLDDHGDLVVLGDSYSHYFVGLDLTADWKGFDLRVFFQGVLKRDFWPGGDASGNNEGGGGYFWGIRGNRSMWHIRGFEQHADYFRAEAVGLPGNEIPANLDSYFPRPLVSPSGSSNGKNQYVQSRYMQDARYIRLKNLQLGYSLPSSLINPIGVSKCRFFVSGENLLTFTPLFSVFDPETAFGGVGGNAYPLSRTLAFGLSVTF